MKDLDIITGCDTGIGNSLVKNYIKNNRPVIYSYVESDPFKDIQNCWGIKLDLKEEDQILSFYTKSKEIIDKYSLSLRALINNSAIGKGGPVENTPMSIYREVMEVNYFGLVFLTQKFIPDLIKTKGRIVIHGSMGGLLSLPFMSSYSTTKFALEALNDSLRRELFPFGVQVSILETGGVATPIWDKVKDLDLSFIDKKYQTYTDAFIKNFVETARRSLNPDIAALRIYKYLNRKRLPYRYKVAENRLVNIIPLFLPTRVMDWILRHMLNM